MVEFPEASGDQLIAAVVGKPIAHSLSPLIHNTAFKQENLDWVYHAIEVMEDCLLYTSPSPRDLSTSRMPSSA